VTGFEVVRLIAARDLRERLRTRAYRLSAVLTALLVAAVVVLPRLFADDEPPTYEVAVVGPVTATVTATVEGVADAVDGADVRFREVDDRAAAEEALDAGDVDLALVEGEVVAREEPDPGDWRAAVAGAIGQLAALERAGLAPDVAAAALSEPPPPVRALEPGSDEEDTRTAVAFVGALLLYTFLSLYGVWVLYGVVEEKSTRVAEVLLSAVPPSALLAGKVIGIGVAALLQGAITVTVALVASVLTGAGLLDAVSPGEVVSLLAWFLLGYVFYAVVYAAAGSLVGRQEDVQNVATPPALPLLVGYLVATQAAFGSSEGPVVRFFSLFPPTAPVVMPVRTTVSDVPAWEVGLAVALTLAATVLLVQLAAKVYARALLRSGGRVRWRDALRATPA